jgi:hypothetical protein
MLTARLTSSEVCTRFCTALRVDHRGDGHVFGGGHCAGRAVRIRGREVILSANLVLTRPRLLPTPARADSVRARLSTIGRRGPG